MAAGPIAERNQGKFLNLIRVIKLESLFQYVLRKILLMHILLSSCKIRIENIRFKVIRMYINAFSISDSTVFCYQVINFLDILNTMYIAFQMPQYTWVVWMIKLQNPLCGNYLFSPDQWVCN